MNMNQQGRAIPADSARQMEIPQQVMALQELNELLSVRLTTLEERLMPVARPGCAPSERLGPGAIENRKDANPSPRGTSTSLGDALYKQTQHLSDSVARIEELTSRLEI
jgi:hypothetical protein